MNRCNTDVSGVIRDLEGVAALVRRISRALSSGNGLEADKHCNFLIKQLNSMLDRYPSMPPRAAQRKVGAR